MMTAKTMNDQEGAEYTHYESQMGSETSLVVVVLSWRISLVTTMIFTRSIEKGLLGAEYRYLDIIKKEDNKFEFDVDKEVNSLLSKDDIVQSRQYSSYDSARYDWSTGKISSRKITRIGSSEIFDDNKSLSQRKEIAQYRLNEVSRAMSELLKTEAMSFVVNGLDFFDGVESTTIGNKLRIRFLKNSITDDSDKFDHKKSGDYLMFACKHSFTPREYTLTFSGVKLSNGGSMIPQAFVDFYGDQVHWFVGEVVNVKDDPLKLGRAQVRAFGVYDDIKDADLPWAQIVVVSYTSST